MYLWLCYVEEMYVSLALLYKSKRYGCSIYPFYLYSYCMILNTNIAGGGVLGHWEKTCCSGGHQKKSCGGDQQEKVTTGGKWGHQIVLLGGGGGGGRKTQPLPPKYF